LHRHNAEAFSFSIFIAVRNMVRHIAEHAQNKAIYRLNREMINIYENDPATTDSAFCAESFSLSDAVLHSHANKKKP
jgi:hypothetical protein